MCMSALALQASALAPVAPCVQMSQVACSRVAEPTMFVGRSKSTPKPAAAPKAVVEKAAKKAAPKKAPVARASQGSAKGKGGIFPWITNEPGTYAEVPMLSQLVTEKNDELTGWGGDVFSLSKFLYPTGAKGMFDKKM